MQCYHVLRPHAQHPKETVELLKVEALKTTGATLQPHTQHYTQLAKQVRLEHGEHCCKIHYQREQTTTYNAWGDVSTVHQEPAPSTMYPNERHCEEHIAPRHPHLRKCSYHVDMRAH